MKRQSILLFILLTICIAGCRRHPDALSCTDLFPFKGKNGKLGYRDRTTGAIVIPAQFDKAYPFLSDLAIVVTGKYEDARYGMIDTCGNYVIPPNYRSIQFPYGSFLEVKGEKSGILNLKGDTVVPLLCGLIEIYNDSFAKVVIGRSGCYRLDSTMQSSKTEDNLVIPTRYNEVRIQNDSLAIVCLNNQYGCYHLDRDQLLIDCQYDQLTICSNGFIKVQKGEKFGYYNSQGRLITPIKYDYARDFSCGYANVRYNKLNGFIDTTGYEKIALQFWDANSFIDNIAIVEWPNGLVGIVNTDGKVVYTGRDRWLGLPPVKNGLVAFCSNNGWGFINKEGKVVIPFMYDNVPWFGFDGDYAMVSDLSNVKVDGKNMYEENAKHALINKQNEMIYPYSTDHFFSVVSDSLICVFDKQTGLSKLVNSRKEEIIPYKYTTIRDYNDDFFLVFQDSLCGLADRQGCEVLPPIYWEIGEFCDGMAMVRDTSIKTGFIDITGKVIIPCKYNYEADVRIFGKFKHGFVSIKNRSGSGEDGYLDKRGYEYWIE